MTVATACLRKGQTTIGREKNTFESAPELEGKWNWLKENHPSPFVNAITAKQLEWSLFKETLQHLAIGHDT